MLKEKVKSNIDAGFFSHLWANANTRKIALYLLLNLAFMVVELVYGVLTNSLGLISDSAHMFFDCSALVLSLFASYFATFPPNGQFGYGYGRVEVVSGLTNCIFLIFVAFSITMESIERIINPQIIHSDKLLGIAIMGLIVNVIGIAFFHAHSHEHSHEHSQSPHHGQDELSPSINENPSNCGLEGTELSETTEIMKENDDSSPNPVLPLTNSNSYIVLEMPQETDHGNENLSGVFLHIIADALGSVGVIVSAILIKYFGLLLADAICSLIISALILASIVPLLKSTLSVLSLQTPAKIQEKVEAVATEILSFVEVNDCTQIRLWRYRKDEVVACIKVEINISCDKSVLASKLKDIMEKKKIKHYTIELNASPTQEK